MSYFYLFTAPKSPEDLKSVMLSLSYYKAFLGDKSNSKVPFRGFRGSLKIRHYLLPLT